MEAAEPPQPLDSSSLRSPSPLPPPESRTNFHPPPQRVQKRKVERFETEQNQSPGYTKRVKIKARERLTRHGLEVAEEMVQIPDLWGQESLMKDWIDCSVFDACLVPGKILSVARAALVEAKRRRAPNPPHSSGIIIQNI